MIRADSCDESKKKVNSKSSLFSLLIQQPKTTQSNFYVF